jgi:hypothetical protein
MSDVLVINPDALPLSPGVNDADSFVQLIGTKLYRCPATLAKAYFEGTGGGGGDVTAPTVTSRTTPNAGPSTIVVVFSESVTVTTAGWSAKKNGSAWSISSVSGSGNTWTFTMGSAAVNGDTLQLSYDSGTGATVDGSANELASFTDASVTNNVAGGGVTYLTWGTLATKQEVYNTSKGIRKKTGEGNSWHDATNNVSVSNQTIGVGERVVFKINDVNADTLMVGLAAGTTAVDIFGATGSPFGIVSAPFIVAYGKENGANAPGTPSEPLSSGNFLCIFYENSTTVKYQKSTDGTSWTTWYTSTNTPSGSYYVHVQINAELTGAIEIYKA